MPSFPPHLEAGEEVPGTPWTLHVGQGLPSTFCPSGVLLGGPVPTGCPSITLPAPKTWKRNSQSFPAWVWARDGHPRVPSP